MQDFIMGREKQFVNHKKPLHKQLDFTERTADDL